MCRNRTGMHLFFNFTDIFYSFQNIILNYCATFFTNYSDKTNNKCLSSQIRQLHLLSTDLAYVCCIANVVITGYYMGYTLIWVLSTSDTCHITNE